MNFIMEQGFLTIRKNPIMVQSFLTISLGKKVDIGKNVIKKQEN